MQRAIFRLFDVSADEDDDVKERLTDAVTEVAMLLDSHLHPTSVQVVFLTSRELDDECRDHLAAWRDEFLSPLTEAGVTLHPHDVREMNDVTAAEYTRMTVVWYK